MRVALLDVFKQLSSSAAAAATWLSWKQPSMLSYGSSVVIPHLALRATRLLAQGPNLSSTGFSEVAADAP